MMKVYERIEEVMRQAGRPIAPHEFEGVAVRAPAVEGSKIIDIFDGRRFIGCSESALGRRLREMREIGRVKSNRREGTAFVEYRIP